MNKVIISVLLSLLSIGSVFSQFDTQFTQYMFNHSAFNPAAVGEGGMIQMTGQLRKQWIGIPNGGLTTVFGINSPIKIGSKLHGIGLKFSDDRIGGFVNQTVHLQYAFKKNIGKGVLSLGADVGFVSLGFNGDSVSAHDITLGNYHDLKSDPEIPQTNVSGMNFDMNVGVYYSTPNYYAGISYSHLNNPNVSWSDYSDINLNGSLFATGGFNYYLANPKYVLKPSGLLKTNFSTFQIDLSARVEYDNKYWGGISYRFQDAISVLAGINIAGGLSIGYSYDLPTSKIILASSGSHELLMVYSFEYIFDKKNSKYKSIRLL